MKKIAVAIFGIFLGLAISGCSQPETINPYLAWEPPKKNPRERVIATPVVLRSDTVGIHRVPPVKVIKPAPPATIPKIDNPEILLEPKINMIEVSISEQRLHAYSISKQGLELQAEFICSTAAGGINYPGTSAYLERNNKNMAEFHNHFGTFTIDEKDYDHVSGRYGCPMPFALHYFDGHWIHATEDKHYKFLGQPASRGCIRLHLRDAIWLYRRVALNKCVLTIDL